MATAVQLVSDTPEAGVVIQGTGGARKIRLAGRGKGKSGGYRVITYFCAEDVPVFLLDVFSKGDKTYLSQAEQRELRELLSELANDWRSNVKMKAAERNRRDK